MFTWSRTQKQTKCSITLPLTHAVKTTFTGPCGGWRQVLSKVNHRRFEDTKTTQSLGTYTTVHYYWEIRIRDGWCYLIIISLVHAR